MFYYSFNIVQEGVQVSICYSESFRLSDFKQARIALERRRFLKNAETAVQRQVMWSDLAHEMTAEFRGLCAEEVIDIFQWSILEKCQLHDVSGSQTSSNTFFGLPLGISTARA